MRIRDTFRTMVEDTITAHKAVCDGNECALSSMPENDIELLFLVAAKTIVDMGDISDNIDSIITNHNGLSVDVHAMRLLVDKNSRMLVKALSRIAELEDRTAIQGDLIRKMLEAEKA